MLSDVNFYEDVFVFDRLTGEMELISISFNGQSADGVSRKPSISADGRFVAFESAAMHTARR